MCDIAPVCVRIPLHLEGLIALIVDEHDWHDQATEMAHTLHEYENKQSHLLRQ